jgi:hypothetical protein
MIDQATIQKAFDEGGSILMSGSDNPRKGEFVSRPEDMPSALELAANDPDRKEAILAQMEADLEAKRAEIEALRGQTGQKATASSEEERLRADLEKLTVPELKAEAEQNGIELPADVTKKADIIDVLVARVKG